MTRFRPKTLWQLTPVARLCGRAWRSVSVLGRLVLFALAFLLAASMNASGDQGVGIRAAESTPLSLKPRNILFSHLSSTDGLSQSSINAIVQDRQGYIWIGTQEGLNRYDGYDFLVFEHDTEDPGSLAHNWVWSLLVDRSGTLWVGTDGGGLSRYDPKTSSFEHFRHDPENPQSLSNDRVRAIYEDREGNLWVGTDGGGLDRMERSSGVFIHYRHDPGNADSLGNDTVLALLEDRRGTLWVGTDGAGVALLDRQLGTFRHLRHDPDKIGSLSHDRVRSLYEDRSGLVWIGTYEGGLNLWDPTTDAVRVFRHDPQDPHSLSNDWIRSLYEDTDGTLWVATDGGINEWRADIGQFVRYKHDGGNQDSLSNDRVTTIFQDQGGVLWVGTYNGINKWNYVSDAFRQFSDGPEQQPRLSGNVITALDESPVGDIWIGTYDAGLNRLDTKTGAVSVYRHRPGERLSIGDDRIMALLVDQEGMVWVGTRSGGLAKLDPEAGVLERFVHDPADPQSLGSNAVTSIYGDRDGTLWVGTYGGGLNRRDPHAAGFRHYRHNPQDASTLSSDRVLALMRDSQGHLWIGTEDGGLNRLDEGTQSFLHHRHDPNRSDSLSSDSAWELAEGRDGSLWIGTMDGGLNRWLPKDRKQGWGRFTRYRKSSGLFSDTVFGILQADDGALWLSSNRGLARFDPQTGDNRQFDAHHGLPRGEFNFGSRLHSHDGRLYFGTTDGLVAFDPSAIRKNLHPPPVVVTARSQLRTLASSSSQTQGSTTVELGFRDSFVAFDFASLDFASPDKNQYRYTLQGFDKGWLDTGKYRRATYTNLPAGSYVFKVMASNNQGVWSKGVASLNLSIAPPPWRSNWAYLLYAIVVVALAAAFVGAHRRRSARKATQHQEMERLIDLRTRELADRNTDLERLNERLERASVTDSLTNLPNRRYLYDLMDKDAAVAQGRNCRTGQQPGQSQPVDISPGLFFMMVDLDGFKLINDYHGHHGGDLALKQVRDILLSCCTSSEQVIRWGGDEFLIVGRPGSRADAERLAEIVRTRIAAHKYQVGGGRVGQLSGSIGFAFHPFVSARGDLFSWEQVINVADQASYIAKKTQRDAWVGIQCARRSVPPDLLENIKHDLEGQIALGNIRITTSIEGRLLLQDRRRLQYS